MPFSRLHCSTLVNQPALLINFALRLEPLSDNCPLAGALAAALRESSTELTSRWLERIAERVNISPNRIFPTDDLLDHVPLLLDGIAGYLENPASEVTTDTPVVAKAMELGALRYAQGFDAYEILKEYEILGGILFTYLANVADGLAEPCEKSELLICGHRLFQAVGIIQQTTTAHFLRLADERVADREKRLRGFNRAISHELKNHIGAVLGAIETIREIPDIAADKRSSLELVIVRNARAMKDTVENLIELSRIDGEPRQHRQVKLAKAIQEATRQVRESAKAAGLRMEVDKDIPDADVNAAGVELCLTNYLTNAIKYTDPARQDRYAKISAASEARDDKGGEIVVRVRTNGLGVPEEKRDSLFQLFFRAHETVTGAEGTGLGLSIVRDTAESLGGRAWAEFDGTETTFAFSLPHRREARKDRRSERPDEERTSTGPRMNELLPAPTQQGTKP